MSTWNIAYTLNKSVICTGDKVILSLEIQNPGKGSYLYIDKISLKGPKTLNYSYNVKSVVLPKSNQNLAILEVPIPIDIKGNVELKLHVDTSRATFKEDTNEINKFENLGILVRKGPIKFQISPTPCYRAFVSRSIHDKDKLMVEPIVKMVQDWGFETNTVGVNISVFNEKHRDPTDIIVEEIIKSDCLIAIATIRDQSAFTGLYSTLQWLHAEVGFAYLQQKPILLITDYRIDLKGILGQKKWPIILFNYNELLKLQSELDEILPHLRLAIAERKAEEFNLFIQDIQRRAAVGGYYAAVEQKRIEESAPSPVSLLSKLKQIS